MMMGNAMANSTSCRPRSSRLKDVTLLIRVRLIGVSSSVENWFRNRRARICSVGRIVFTITNHHSYADIFSLQIATVAALYLTAKEEGPEVINLYGGAPAVELALFDNRNQDHSPAVHAVMLWTLARSPGQILCIGNAFFDVCIWRVDVRI